MLVRCAAGRTLARVNGPTRTAGLPAVDLLGVRVDATSYADATERIVRWAEARHGCYVCCANVHVVMEANDSPEVARAVNGAALVTPDGMPLVWFVRGVGLSQARVYGPDLMLHVCEAAAARGISVGLLGSTRATLTKLEARLVARFPGLSVVYRHAPPFRAPSAAEDARVIADCQEAGVRILFVGLGCPKQEVWMAQHVGRLSAVLIGVGAAFDFHAGTVRQAPAWMQRSGLEWLYRLSREPRRLARRYARHNPRFVARALPALLRQRRAQR
jgi:N-acetylglucosaminyldiphosphoundecaprenol N-acetyl-beta-D-mannosaminyltransferase